MAGHESSLKDKFLSLVYGGEGTLLDWARAGKLTSILNESEIACLICEGRDTGPMRRGGVIGELRLAALRGDIKATLSEFDLWGIKPKPTGPAQEGQLYCYIHRDDARRYFARIGLDIPAGCPLWCWLNAKQASEASKLRQDQRDKADYQQECSRVWGISNALSITGLEGITYHPDLFAWRSRYEGGTLEKWAREVAPDGVKGKRGRRKKSAPA
ncbi:hypothetical protein [Sulfuritalea sp.]|uniref:hypothetical protein n=1 Tax=Sulfuritalea sp. TaxID=2480090 RepID=UPI00286D9D7E|nr:hypothetical protein [Sulfuritalea sp.]